MIADTLTMICTKKDIETTVFNVSFQSLGNSMMLPATFSERLFIFWALVFFVLRTLTWLLSLTNTVVDGHCFRPSVAVVDRHRFRPTWHLELIFHDVGTATIRTIGRRVEHVDNHQNYRSKSGLCCREQTRFLHVDGAAMSARTFPHPSVVVNCNKLDRTCFCNVTTRMLCFVLQDS